MKITDWAISLLLVFSSLPPYEAINSDQDPKLYIVYLGANVHPTIEATYDVHHRMLSHVFDSKEKVLECIVHHYRHGFSGFAAKITPAQAEMLSKLPEVVSIFESRSFTLTTTRSWNYLGLNPSAGVWPETNFGQDVIIGVIDSGIWPESQSFKDEGLSEIPSRWKGKCWKGEQFDPATHCNKKIIGAKWFIAGAENSPDFNASSNVISARDTEGHGTHCASVAAGGRVKGVNISGLAAGTAVGGAPYAKIAVYKVCWPLCTYADYLAGFDEAIHDGVDIISLSLGPDSAEPYHVGSISSYHATVAGILVSEVAGNAGPGEGTVTNVAPWSIIVGASSTDRKFLSDVKLGDGPTIEGLTVNLHTKFDEEPVPLVSGRSIHATNFTSEESSFCLPGSLNETSASGNVVLCKQLPVYRLANGSYENLNYTVVESVLQAKAYGAIIASENFTNYFFTFTRKLRLFDFSIPEAGISSELAAEMENYILNSRSAPTATVKRPKTVYRKRFSQIVAPFSSRGPNVITPDILKPDVIAPGVDIVAAYTEAQGNPDHTKYKFDSGTSMACPHVTGAAALIKAKNPTWSPAAIKSALMTTAKPLKTGNSLAWGSGEIDIINAMDPGLVYDLGEEDYAVFLCNANYTNEQYIAVTGRNLSSCPVPAPGPAALNYPSISTSEDCDLVRTFTYVDEYKPAGSTYMVTIVEPPSASITVHPHRLCFSRLHEKKSYTVSIRIKDSERLPSFGSITWSDAHRRVKTPVMVHKFVQPL